MFFASFSLGQISLLQHKGLPRFPHIVLSTDNTAQSYLCFRSSWPHLLASRPSLPEVVITTLFRWTTGRRPPPTPLASSAGPPCPTRETPSTAHTTSSTSGSARTPRRQPRASRCNGRRQHQVSASEFCFIDPHARVSDIFQGFFLHHFVL